MFSSPLKSSRPKDSPQQQQQDISPLLAAELGIEYASLRAPNGCPEGMYVMPSTESLLKWRGVFFVHRGPYAGSILRFTLLFPSSYPQSAPTIRFDSDVFHHWAQRADGIFDDKAMVDPKTKVWHARGRLAQWKPRIVHVSHLLHTLKGSFKTRGLESVTEEEAVNKPVWSLYHHSQQTFVSMTAQRSLHSSSRAALYAEPTLSAGADAADSPRTRTRKVSMQSLSEEEGRKAIRFRQVDEDERRAMWEGLKVSLG